MKKLLALAMMICLSGCLERIGQIDRNLKPYGANWIKEGMTRESRRVDFMQCGGGEHLSDGYKDWLSSIPYEIYAQGKSTHIKDLTACMHAKSYFYLEQCDARCLHP
jgi:hypothetical protein